MLREQYIRLEVRRYMDYFWEKKSPDPGKMISDFLTHSWTLIKAFDEEVRTYITCSPDIEPIEKEALLTQHIYRAQMLCRKVDLIENLVLRAQQRRGSDNLLELRILGAMGAVQGELTAMRKRIF